MAKWKDPRKNIKVSEELWLRLKKLQTENKIDTITGFIAQCVEDVER